MFEVWKDIKGFEGKYQISNKGNVKSLRYNNTDKEKIMIPQLNKRGFHRVNLWKNNKAYQFLVGTLVAEHFLKKENPNDIPIHIKDKTDDSVGNLMFVSRSESVHRSYNKAMYNNERRRRIKYNFNSSNYKKFKEIANKNGITAHQMYKRLYEGWTIEEASTIPMDRKERILSKTLYEYNGKLMSVKQLAKINGLNENIIYKRLSRGWTINEAVEIPNLKTN